MKYHRRKEYHNSSVISDQHTWKSFSERVILLISGWHIYLQNEDDILGCLGWYLIYFQNDKFTHIMECNENLFLKA